MYEQLYACFNPTRPEVGFVLTVVPSCPCGMDDCLAVYTPLPGHAVVRRESARNAGGNWVVFEMIEVTDLHGRGYYIICNGACISEGTRTFEDAEMVWVQTIKALHIAREYLDGRVDLDRLESLLKSARNIDESLSLGLLTGDAAWGAITDAIDDLHEGK